MKAHALEVLLHSFLTVELDGRESLASRPGCFTPEERSLVPIKRGLDGSQNPPDRFGKINFLASGEIRTPDRSLRSLVTVLAAPFRFAGCLISFGKLQIVSH